jgi:uncharacterized membrane protein YkvA (DUF1232 family)
MSNRPTQSTVREASISIGNWVRQARLVWRLLKDGRVPTWVKLVPAAGLIYLLSPIDLIPDLMLPGLGQLDDVAIVLLTLKAFVNLAPPGIVREHLEILIGKAAGTTPAPTEGETIDVEYRVIGDDDRESG